MINSILSVLVGSLGFIAGIGMLHWLLMFVLLISAGVLYLALSEQYESGKAMGIAAVLYVLMVGWSFLIL